MTLDCPTRNVAIIYLLGKLVFKEPFLNLANPLPEKHVSF